MARVFRSSLIVSDRDLNTEEKSACLDTAEAAGTLAVDGCCRHSMEIGELLCTSTPVIWHRGH